MEQMMSGLWRDKIENDDDIKMTSTSGCPTLTHVICEDVDVGEDIQGRPTQASNSNRKKQ